MGVALILASYIIMNPVVRKKCRKSTWTHCLVLVDCRSLIRTNECPNVMMQIGLTILVFATVQTLLVCANEGYRELKRRRIAQVPRAVIPEVATQTRVHGCHTWGCWGRRYALAEVGLLYPRPDRFFLTATPPTVLWSCGAPNGAVGSCARAVPSLLRSSVDWQGFRELVR
jgi:hypothetical protein